MLWMALIDSVSGSNQRVVPFYLYLYSTIISFFISKIISVLVDGDREVNVSHYIWDLLSNISNISALTMFYFLKWWNRLFKYQTFIKNTLIEEISSFTSNYKYHVHCAVKLYISVLEVIINIVYLLLLTSWYFFQFLNIN